MGGAARGSPPRRGWSAAPLPAAPEALGCVWQVMRRAGARCPPHWPLCAGPKPSGPRLQPGLWSGGRSQLPGCRDGAGPMPQMEPTAPMPPRSPTSSPGTPGTSCSPRTPRGAVCSRRTGPGPAAPPAGTLWSQAGLIGQVPRAGAGDPVGRVSPRARAAMETQPPLPEAQTLVHFLGHTGKLVICLRGSTPS